MIDNIMANLVKALGLCMAMTSPSDDLIVISVLGLFNNIQKIAFMPPPLWTVAT